MSIAGDELTTHTGRRLGETDLCLSWTVLQLHRRGQTVADISSKLEEIIVSVGLAKESRFVPASAVQEAPKDSDLVVEVRTSWQELMGWLHVRGTDAGQFEAVQLLAAHAGRALGQAQRLIEYEHQVTSVERVSEALQDALLPVLPDLPHTSLAVRYRAAGRDAKVGGDFYDVAPLPNGQSLIVVGDVVGKGIEA